MLRTLLTKLLVFIVVGVPPISLAVAAPSPVGRIALTVGEAKRINADGHTAPLRSGTSVSEGDRIITGGDAVVIIVFVDEGRISLRSDSELLVKQYMVDPAGVNSRLDFELIRGSIRQISGQAARMQPERYRLNTPVASIGVRGTDFLAKTSGDTLETFVQEGKIVLLSSAASCNGSTQTSTCAPLADMAATDSARYLKMFAGGKIERRVVASDEIERVFGISLVKATPATTGAATQVALNTTPPVVTKSLDSAPRDLPTLGLNFDKTQTPTLPKIGDLVVVAPVTPPQPVNPSPAPIEPPAPVAPPPVVSIPPAVVSPPATVETPPPVTVLPTPPVVVEPPPVVVATPPPTPTPQKPVLALQNTPDLTRQLVWGKFDRADKLPLQLLTTYDAAKEGRSVSVGDLGQFALWRNGPNQTLASSLKGEVQFDIRAGEAYLQQGTAMLPATLSNPSLSVDFDRARFATSLTLNQAQTGDVTLQATGKMDDEGNFLSVVAGQRVAGAVSFDAKEAGYWFSRDHTLGVFKGVTLWNAR